MSVEDGQQQVKPYSNLRIGPDEVLQIIVTSDQKHLYILSKHKVLSYKRIFIVWFNILNGRKVKGFLEKDPKWHEIGCKIVLANYLSLSSMNKDNSPWEQKSPSHFFHAPLQVYIYRAALFPEANMSTCHYKNPQTNLVSLSFTRS